MQIVQMLFFPQHYNHLFEKHIKQSWLTETIQVKPVCNCSDNTDFTYLFCLNLNRFIVISNRKRQNRFSKNLHEVSHNHYHKNLCFVNV